MHAILPGLQVSSGIRWAVNGRQATGVRVDQLVDGRPVYAEALCYPCWYYR